MKRIFVATLAYYLASILEMALFIPWEMKREWEYGSCSDRTQTGYGFLNPPLSSILIETNKLRQKIGLRTIELRNKLVDVENETGMNFYLPDWIDGKIEVIQE